MYGYIFLDYERLVGEVVKEIGFEYISLSYELMLMIKLVLRVILVCVDVYFMLVIKKYIVGFQNGFEGGSLGLKSVKENGEKKGVRCEFM